MKSPQHVFVVDADIARAAGPHPKDRPWSDRARICNELLEGLWRCQGYRVAFDSRLHDEWKKHQGMTAMGWFARMLARGRIYRVNRLEMVWLQKLIKSQLGASDRAAALKDAHLVALACEPGDQRLLSNDAKARGMFQQLRSPKVLAIHWVSASPDCVRWLIDGAPNRQEWCLGAGKSS